MSRSGYNEAGDCDRCAPGVGVSDHRTTVDLSTGCARRWPCRNWSVSAHQDHRSDAGVPADLGWAAAGAAALLAVGAVAAVW